jgi:predicted Zn-dependent protease
MDILSKEEARQILEKAISFSEGDACVANLNGSKGGNIRYARNSVSTSGVDNNLTLAVQVFVGKKTGTATTNEFNDEAIQKAVKRATELAQLSPENPEFLPPLMSQNYKDNPLAFSDTTAAIDPEYRASVAASSIQPAKKDSIECAGFLEDAARMDAMMNSAGLFAYHKYTDLDFSVTMRTADGTGSAWVSKNVNDVAKFNASEVSLQAIEKSLQSRNPKAIEPGKYTVILEPAASIGLLQSLFFGLDARQADEGRSFLSQKGGGTKLGEKIVDDRVRVYSDPFHPDLPISPWDRDGLPRERMEWIEGGVVKNLYYSRYWAMKKGVAPVSPPGGVVMEGGDASLEDMIKDTKKGIYVSRLWYIRGVDPQTLLFTGLTRDGTFLIENGKIKHPVKNFRFNESPIIMLNNLEALGKQERTGGALIPLMKVRDFTFTSLSDAI